MDDFLRILRARVGAVLVAPLVVALAGCAIGTPVYIAAPSKGDGPGDKLQVSITHAVVRPQHRAVFDRYVRQIALQLPQQDGMVAFSIRKEVLGEQVWTLT